MVSHLQQNEPMPMIPSPMRAFWGEQACELVTYHAPTPVMVEYHHQKPVFLQNQLYGRVIFGPSLWVCSNCHDSIHAWLYWLLGMHRQPASIGRNARHEAELTFQWFQEELLNPSYTKQEGDTHE